MTWLLRAYVIRHRTFFPGTVEFQVYEDIMWV